jgi:hypothetical protein
MVWNGRDRSVGCRVSSVECRGAQNIPPPAQGELRCYLLQGNVCRGFVHVLGATEGATEVLPTRYARLHSQSPEAGWRQMILPPRQG